MSTTTNSRGERKNQHIARVKVLDELPTKAIWFAADDVALREDR